MSFLSSPESFTGQEQNSSSYPGLNFEPGHHPKNDTEKDAILSIINSGKFYSFWNPEINKKMAAYQPQLIAVDGFSPKVLGLERNHDDKLWEWACLPARPRELNHKGEVFVIGGDLAPRNGPISLFAKTVKEVGANPASPKSQTILSQTEGLTLDLIEEVKKTKDTQVWLAAGENTVWTVVGALLFASMRLSAENDIKAGAKFSRRSFLKYSALFGGGMALGSVPFVRNYMLDRATTSPNKQEELEFRKFVDLLAPIINPDDIVNGRTAMLIAKGQDSINALNLPKDIPSSVVMGQTHTFGASNFLENKQARNEAIEKMAKQILHALNVVLEKYPDYPIREARNYLLDSIAAVEITKVSDNKNKSSASLPDIDESVEVVKRFNSPQVESAISQLR